MLTDYSISLYSPDGSAFLADLSGFSDLQYTRSVNAIGRLQLVIDSRLVPRSLFEHNGQVKRDQRIVVYRKPQGGVMSADGETCWFIREVTRSRTSKHDTYTVVAVDAIDLLRRRVIAYPVSATETIKTAPADDLMKQIVRENFISATDTTRNMSGFSSDVNYSVCPSITKEMARRRVIDTLRELADACAAPILTGYRFLFYDVVPTSTGFVFRTYVDQRGSDVRSQFRLGDAYGNLAGHSVKYSAIDEITRQYAGGEGQKNDRFIVQADNVQAQGASPYNLIEQFEDGSNGETTAAVQGEAYNKLNEYRAHVRFEGGIIEGPSARYGVDYAFGDRVNAQAFGQTFDCRVGVVTVSVSNLGETIDAKLVSEAFV